MMNLQKKMVLAFFFPLLYLTNCTFVTKVKLQRSSSQEVEVFMKQMPPQSFVEIKYIRINAPIWKKANTLLQKLKENAKQEGADALINVTYDFQSRRTTISGLAIKYNLTEK
ncbi:MAG: hypothetical protein SFU27_06350 [Thermonemataceae bacterium]|nr:hypothetical protein [Thermonemataceae bacterium]